MHFTAGWDSLKRYRCPEWFRDAKFGIWAHWGPQSVPEAGDWYARNMYIEGCGQYKHHLKSYGHPSKFGYKDIVKLWKAENFDPRRLMKLYRKAGAKYFVAMGCHHDNFDCWNSKHHKWNSVELGPKKDIVGLWREAAIENGMRFGVSEHMERCYSWFNTNKGADKEGPLAGVPYDGNDPEYSDFYFPKHDDSNLAYPANPPQWWKEQWRNRILDLVSQYKVDLLYTDGGIPFGEIGRDVVAQFYNMNMEWHGSNLEAVYAVKDSTSPMLMKYGNHGEFQPGIGVLDVERGVMDGIQPDPWQTDTSIGDWFYNRNWKFQPISWILHMLVDIVSKNGNLLLNVVQRPDGTLDPEVEESLAGISEWIGANGEGIYGTRPWKVFGEGPTKRGGGMFEEKEMPYTESDFRFTCKGSAVFVFQMKHHVTDRQAFVRNLGSKTDIRIKAVRLPNSDVKVSSHQHEEGLLIQYPEKGVSGILPCFAVELQE